MLSLSACPVNSGKSRNAGKRLLLISIILLTVFITQTANAQQLRIITLDQDEGLLAEPSRIVLYPGETLQFVSTNGDFNIYIEDAISFLRIKEADLIVRVNSAGTAESEIYTVRDVDEEVIVSYAIYCITTNSWPDAPPKIIIVVQ